MWAILLQKVQKNFLLRFVAVAEAVKMGDLQTEPFKAKQGGYLTLNVGKCFFFQIFLNILDPNKKAGFSTLFCTIRGQ